MSDDSQHPSFRANSDMSIHSNDISSLTSYDSQANEIKDTVIRLVTKNDWSVSMQIRLESLHSGKGKRWSPKKLRRRPPNPFFEISVFHDESSLAG